MISIRKQMLLAATGCMLILSSCSQSSGTNEAGKKENQDKIPVKTLIAQKQNISRYIDFTSSLTPFEEVHLAPSVPGRIRKINVEIGSNVVKGQLLVQMDPTSLEQSRISLSKIETDFRRLDTLKKTNSIADQQYDQAKSALDIARNSYRSLEENTQLLAPFGGVVSGKYFEDGEIYTGSPNATVGKPAILSIIQINQLKALIGVTSNYYPLVKPGMKAEIRCDIYPEESFTGEVYRIYPTIDNATKTFTVEVSIRNENLKLRPGMFAKIMLELGKGEALMVPTIALIKQTGTNDMYLFLNRDGKAVKQQVQIGRIVDDQTEILSGISEGDEIIVTGQNKLVSQSPLLVVK